MSENTLVTCPECGANFDVQEILKHELAEGLRAEYEKKSEKLRKELQAKERKILDEKIKLEKEQEDFSAKVEEEAKALLKTKEKDLLGRLEKKFELEKEALIEEQEETKKEIEKLRQTAIEKERLERKLGQVEKAAELKYQKLMSKQLEEELAARLKLSESEHELRVRELTEKLERTSEQLADAQRRIEQGSVQLQGEVQELMIEDWLRQNFNQDEITEVKKGAAGADCIHKIRDNRGEEIGIVYYESKRTKTFSATWVHKFKEDMRARKADVGILVTQAMPLDTEHMGFKDNILICSYPEFKAASYLIREHVKAVAAAAASQENRGEKIALIYDYLRSNEFRMSVEGIVDAFTAMRNDLESEKRTTQARWAKREKQIDQVIVNTTRMYGAIHGIAGGEIQAVPALELDGITVEARVLSD